MNSSDQEFSKFLMVWDIYGLEYLFDLSEWEKKVVWAKLKDEKPPQAPNLNILLLRARTNSHRKYEIYIVSCDPSMDYDFWKKTWETDPQTVANLVREKGEKIYSDYSSQNSNQVVF